MSETLTIEGWGPVSIQRPGNVAQAGDAIRQAAAAGQAVYPIGGRTALGIGLPPRKPGLAIDLCGINSLVDYPAADMTVTVQAGMTVASLQSLLAREKQWLPVDLALPAQATLGGAVAVNAAGPRRLGYGTLRDYLIGISFLTDKGDEVKGGGRVVKNVAGYDLMKMQIGALGTLGIITQLTFKVRPLPEERALVILGTSSQELAARLDTLHASNSRPIAVDVLNSPAAKSLGLEANSDWIFLVGFEEKAVTVKSQIETLRAEWKADGELRTGDQASAVWSALTEYPCRSTSKFVGKSGVLPSAVAARLLAANSPSVRLHAHALNGIIWTHADERTTQPGNIYTQAPAEGKTHEQVWGTPGSDWALKTHIKRTVDPGDLFNPGRLFAPC
ncbi:MAG: FAD-binding oxidoreductase [Gemmataceae bacterium]